MRHLLRSVLLSLGLCVSVAPAFACKIIPQTPERYYADASAVFAGRVISVEEADGQLLNVTIAVSQIWKGVELDEGGRVIVKTSNSTASCGIAFEKNASYLVYATMEEGLGLSVHAGGTKLFLDADADVRAIGNPSQILDLGMVPLEDDYTGFANPFPDVPTSHSAYKAANTLKENAMVHGNPDGTFRPDNKLNRAEFLQMMMNTVVKDEDWGTCVAKSELKSQFPDVPNNAWYAEAVCQAKARNIVKGYSDSTFRPEMNINAAEAAKIVVQTLSLGSDIDEEKAAVWYAPYEEILREKEAIPASIKSMNQLITRGEMAIMLFIATGN